VGFAQPAADGRTGSQVPRRELLQIAPTLAVGAAAAPSYGQEAVGQLQSGITQPWGKRPDGDDDEIHTGGVAWEDLKVGTGPEPRIGDQIAIDFRCTAVVQERLVVVEDTKGRPKDYRFGVGQMLPGMDEGIRGMRSGGKRKLQIPGQLAFGKKSVPAAPGRPTVPIMSPVEVVVTLAFLPGRDEVYEYASEY